MTMNYSSPAIKSVEKSNISLGQVPADALWDVFEITNVCNRGLVTYFSMTLVPVNTGTMLWDIQVRGDGSNGALSLEALGNLGTSYTISLPWSYAATSGTSLWIYIRNRGTEPVAFTVASLKAERFA